MQWKFDEEKMIEYTTIKYGIDNKDYYASHTFKIFEINMIKQILEKNELKYSLYDNYSLDMATDNSKNIQVVLFN